MHELLEIDKSACLHATDVLQSKKSKTVDDWEITVIGTYEVDPNFIGGKQK